MPTITNGENGASVRTTLNRVVGLRINHQTGSYTIVADDHAKLVAVNSVAAVVVTVPSGLPTDFCCKITQLGVGAVSVVGSGAVVNSFEDVMELPGQYSSSDLYCTGANEFLLVMQGGAAEPPLPISDTAITSAGVYDDEGVLVRTLWSAEVGNPNRNDPAAAWDGTLEDLTVAPTGNYTIKVLAHNCTYTWEGVIGNTSPDHTTMRYWNEACPTNDMEIMPDGKMWYCTQYHERLPVVGYSQTTDIQNQDYGITPTSRAAYIGATRVTANSDYAFFAYFAAGETWVMVIDQVAKFWKDFGPNGEYHEGMNGVKLSRDTTTGNWITSLVVQRTATGVGTKILTPVNMTGNNVPAPYVTSATSELAPGYEPFRAFDGNNINSAWATALSGLPQSIKIDLGTAFTADIWKYTARYFAVENGPIAGTLEGSNNDSTWTTIDTFSGLSAWTPLETRSFTIDTPGSYRYYRWTFTSTSGGNGAEATQLQLVASSATIPLLFVCRPEQNKILTLNGSTGDLLQSDTTTFVKPTIAQINHSDNSVWIYHEVGGAKRITKCTVSSAGALSTTATFATGITDINSISISPDGTTLLVAERDTHQIKAYNTSDGSVKTTFGSSGLFGTPGGYVNSPDVTNTKFMFITQDGFGGGGAWVAYAPDGSFWVGDCGNCRHLHFTSGNSPTYIEQVMYLPAGYPCDVCRGDPTRVFFGWHEFAIDYDLPLAIGNGSWTYVRNWGGGQDTSQTNYVKLGYVGVYSNGRVYALIPTPAGREWKELTSTGLRGTGKFYPGQIYFDKDMNAYYTFWGGADTWSRIFTNPFTGFDELGNPTWKLVPGADMDIYFTTQDLPASFPVMGVWDGNTPYNRIEPTQNNMIVFADPDGSRGWDGTHWTFGINHLGAIDATTGAPKWNTYSTQGRVASRGNQYFMLEPEIPFWMTGNGIWNNAGGNFHYEPGQPHIFVCNVGEGGWGNNQTNVWAHYHDSGLMMNRWGPVAPYFASTSLLRPDIFVDDIPNSFQSFKGMDGMAGNTKWGGIAHVNGKYYLYQMDEWYHSGILRWRIDNVDDFFITTTNVSWNSGSYVAPTLDPNDLLAGLPFDSLDIPNNTAGWVRTPPANVGDSIFTAPFVRCQTNLLTNNPRLSPDLVLECNVFDTTPVSIYKAIPRVGSGNWTLSGKIYLQYGGDAHPDPTAYTWMAFEILDNTGKVIFTIHSYNAWPSVDAAGTKVNGTDLFTPFTFTDVTDGVDREPRFKLGNKVERQVPFIVAANIGAGNMSITYGEWTTTKTVFEGGAALGAPARVQLKFKPRTDANAFYTGACITRLRYSES